MLCAPQAGIVDFVHALPQPGDDSFHLHATGTFDEHDIARFQPAIEDGQQDIELWCRDQSPRWQSASARALSHSVSHFSAG